MGYIFARTWPWWGLLGALVWIRAAYPGARLEMDVIVLLWALALGTICGRVVAERRLTAYCRRRINQVLRQVELRSRRAAGNPYSEDAK